MTPVWSNHPYRSAAFCNHQVWHNDIGKPARNALFDERGNFFVSGVDRIIAPDGIRALRSAQIVLGPVVPLYSPRSEKTAQYRKAFAKTDMNHIEAPCGPGLAGRGVRSLQNSTLIVIFL